MLVGCNNKPQHPDEKYAVNCFGNVIGCASDASWAGRAEQFRFPCNQKPMALTTGTLSMAFAVCQVTPRPMQLFGGTG